MTTRELDWIQIGEYPKTIPLYHVRYDVFTNKAVERGAIYHLNEGSRKLSLKEFNKLLQCPKYQPDLDGKNGVLSFLKLIPPTREILELMCAYAETECSNWNSCRESVKQFKENKSYPLTFWEGRNGFAAYRLYRIDSDGNIFYDWPWGRERIDEDMKFENSSPQTLMKETLDKVLDIGESVFFEGDSNMYNSITVRNDCLSYNYHHAVLSTGSEQPSFPWTHPFPLFSCAPGLDRNHIPWPWPESVDSEKLVYEEVKYSFPNNDSPFNNLFEIFQQKYYTNWDNRESKAAFFASTNNHRLMIFELARKYPDYFYCQTRPLCPNCPIYSFNPSDPDSMAGSGTWDEMSSEERNLSLKLPLGHVKGLLHFGYNTETSQEYPFGFKYVIVPLGSEAESTSGRLAYLLAHSGAVILLQSSTFTYHFSARLQPWVHFVPLCYTMADAAEKVEWLRAHDHLAKRIAENARNFGKSYLRLEDYYCYAAAALNAVSRILNGSSALKPFNQSKINYFSYPASTPESQENSEI